MLGEDNKVVRVDGVTKKVNAVLGEEIEQMKTR